MRASWRARHWWLRKRWERTIVVFTVHLPLSRRRRTRGASTLLQLGGTAPFLPPHLPLPPLPLSIPLPSPFPRLLRPFNPARGSGERCKLPGPRPQTHFCAILTLEDVSGGNKTVIFVKPKYLLLLCYWYLCNKKAYA